jgi:hypothetical protein
MKHLEKLLELSDAEFGAIAANGKFKSREEIDSVYKLMDIVKDVYCVWSYEDEMDGESYDDGYGRSMRGSYDGGMSYARGRRNARRDERGRYSRDGYMDSYNDGRSMRGYSRADGKEDYKNQLRMMMEDAPDEQTRQSIKRMLDTM